MTLAKSMLQLSLSKIFSFTMQMLEFSELINIEVILSGVALYLDRMFLKLAIMAILHI